MSSTKDVTAWWNPVQGGDIETPLRWRKPRLARVAPGLDLFHESVPDEFIDRVFAVMALSPKHTFQVLTERPERMLIYLSERESHERVVEEISRSALDWGAAKQAEALGGKWWDGQYSEGRCEIPGGFVDVSVPWPLPNVWLGTNVEDLRVRDLPNTGGGIR